MAQRTRAISGMLASWGEGDVKRLAEIDFSHLDLTWMSQLSQFDHWDLERHSPWDDVSSADEAAEWYRDREPRLERLTPWVKLRLMKGLADGEPWDALAETRQLTRLLLSTQSLLARWRAWSRVGGDGRLLGEDDGSAPAMRRLALLLSPPLRAAIGEPLLYDAAIAALHASR